MKIAPFIDPDGIACDRERAAYRAELITERDRFLIAFLPMAEDGLTYLERVGVFSIPLHPGIDRETALRPRYMVTGARGRARCRLWARSLRGARWAVSAPGATVAR